jgi:hypothetical protein
MTLRVMLMAALMMAPALAAAAEPAKKGEKTQVVNFEDDTIQGDLTKPDGEYVEARKAVNHTNLIRIREEFRDKVLQSVSDL